MQLAKGSAEDLPSGLAANFRAFDFTRLSIERVVITDGFEKDVCLSSARRSRADLYQDCDIFLWTLLWITLLLSSDISPFVVAL